MSIKDFYMTSPSDLEPGDVLVCTVTLHVGYHENANGNRVFRMYRCRYPGENLGSDGIPQGDRIYTNQEEVAQALFPIALNAGFEPDS